MYLGFCKWTTMDTSTGIKAIAWLEAWSLFHWEPQFFKVALFLWIVHYLFIFFISEEGKRIFTKSKYLENSSVLVSKIKY